MSTPLAGDVPPQPLMSPVHSADRRRPGHLAGGVPVHSLGGIPVHSTGRQCATSAFNEPCPLARYRGSSHDISILYALWTLWRSEFTLAL
jgi:hypothetical protein